MTFRVEDVDDRLSDRTHRMRRRRANPEEEPMRVQHADGRTGRVIGPKSASGEVLVQWDDGGLVDVVSAAELLVQARREG